MSYRKNDPDSSRLAYATACATGKISSQREKVLQYVKKYPRRTSKQLAEIAKSSGDTLDRFDFARRLPELRDKGLIEVCGTGERKQLLWKAK